MTTVDLSERLAFLQRQLHAINQATAAALARGDQEGVTRLRALFAKLAADIEVLKADARRQEAPSAFMLTLAAFSDEAVKVGTTLGSAAVDVVQGVGTLVRWLPIILLGAALIVGLIYAGKLGKELRK